jgi:SAM-dependent methyltransferase
MTSRAAVGRAVRPAGTLLAPAVTGLWWSLDRVVAVAYGLVYDAICEHFAPYRELRADVLALVERAAGDGVARRDVRVLEADCGPGAFTIMLAEAGFSVVGIDRYRALLELAREKRRAAMRANLAFARGDLEAGTAFADGAFDQLVTIHALYAHARPEGVLREAHRLLKPGGQAVLVNHTRRVGLLSTLRAVRRAGGLRPALAALRWLLPNALFETARHTGRSHYWEEAEFARRLREAGFAVVGMRRTFLDGASLLVVARKEAVAR